MNTQSFKEIRAWHTSWILPLTDLLFIIPCMKYFANKTTDSLRLEYSMSKGQTKEEARKAIEEDIRHGAFFMTNHRDIVMDPVFLSFLLRTRYWIRPYVGLGNNLLGKWWIKPFCRFNRGFIVIRDGSMREQLEHSKVLSSYLHYLLKHHKSIWLAQHEGRTKDGNDITQHAILKMLALGDESSFIDSIYKLNICPASLSYEYDPCDYLKAAEMQLKRDNPNRKKEKGEDILSMKTGITGKKGNVVIRLTPSINHWIDQNRTELESMSRNDQIKAIADRIDYQIHSAYEIYERGPAFDQYIESRLAMINIPNKDETYLRERLYEMYNNPVINHDKAIG